jgi:hypothetical protein
MAAREPDPRDVIPYDARYNVVNVRGTSDRHLSHTSWRGAHATMTGTTRCTCCAKDCSRSDYLVGAHIKYKDNSTYGKEEFIVLLCSVHNAPRHKPFKLETGTMLTRACARKLDMKTREIEQSSTSASKK